MGNNCCGCPGPSYAGGQYARGCRGPHHPAVRTRSPRPVGQSRARPAFGAGGQIAHCSPPRRGYTWDSHCVRQSHPLCQRTHPYCLTLIFSHRGIRRETCLNLRPASHIHLLWRELSHPFLADARGRTRPLNITLRRRMVSRETMRVVLASLASCVGDDYCCHGGALT